MQGDGNADADAARGESCASADDERHANGDDAKRWWVQSPAAEDGHWWVQSAAEDGQRDK